MTRLRELLTEHSLASRIEQIEAVARPSVYLHPGDSVEDACTRLGGRPNLPAHIDWPTWREKPLAFVAQLDLAALPRIEGLNLPAVGALYFFYESGEQPWGFEPGDKGSAAVIYGPTGAGQHPARNPPKDLPEALRFSPVCLTTEAAGGSLPEADDQLISRLGLSMDELSGYWNFSESWRAELPATFHKIGGYPETVQGDPRLEAQLVSHGLYCGDGSGYEHGKELGLWDGATDWELLLQVDSDDKAGMMWGDAARLYFLIRKQDLAGQAFDRAWLILQCG